MLRRIAKPLSAGLAVALVLATMGGCGRRESPDVRIFVRDARGAHFTGAIVEWAGGFAPITDKPVRLPPGVKQATVWGGGCRPVRLTRLPGHVLVGMTPGPLLEIRAEGARHLETRGRKLQLLITRVEDDVAPPRDTPVAVPADHVWTEDGWRPKEIFVDPTTETALVYVMAPGTYRMHWHIWRGTIRRDAQRFVVSGAGMGPDEKSAMEFTVEDGPLPQSVAYPISRAELDRWLPNQDDEQRDD